MSRFAIFGTRSLHLVPPVLLAAALAAGCTGCAKDKPRATMPLENESRSQLTELTGAGAASGKTAKSGAACGPRGLPPDRHFVAEGLCARVVAHKQGEVRGITFAPNGDLLAVTTDGDIRRYRDTDHDGIYGAGAPETIVWARTGGDNGHNCFIDGLDLYCGSKTGVNKRALRLQRQQGGPDVRQALLGK